MAKGFLSRLMQKLAGAPEAESGVEPVAEPLVPLEELLAPHSGRAEDTLIQLCDFMKPYKAALAAMPVPKRAQKNPLLAPRAKYFALLSHLQSEMVQGDMSFIYPKPGVYKYPERNMFFAEHCYVAVSHLVKTAYTIRDRYGNPEGADTFARTLIAVTQDSAPRRKEELLEEGHAYESGQTAAQKFFLSAYEHGNSFALVLRYHPEGQKTVQKFEP